MNKESEYGEAILIECDECYTPICRAYPDSTHKLSMHYRFVCERCKLPEGVEVTA